MDAIRDFYQLSEIMGDDIYKVANAIRSYHPCETIMDIIISDLENLNIAEYENTISSLLDLSTEALLKAGMGVTFSDERSYIVYLQKVMDGAGVIYVPFVRKSLFD